MSPLTMVPALLSVAILSWLWTQRWRRRGSDLVVQALLPALVPASAAAAAAGWTVRAEYDAIAQTGRGGVGLLAQAMEGPAETLLVGVVSAIAIVTGAMVMGRLRRTPPRTDAGGPASQAGMTVLVRVLGLALAAVAVHAADRAVFGVLAKLVPTIRGLTATASVPRLVGSAGLAAVSDLERWVYVSTWGASVLCALLILASLVETRASSAPGRSVGWPAPTTAALVVLAAAGTYLAYLWPAVGWLGELASGLTPR